ncbi:flagellar basal body L-ring protein FlgH [sulfur-oxidizing endosymbiont of Gigantopelta aegis]|uniref:flagellar basal body L-ring protein FlgH n=1 Tax=sulfur-oxidizing endosymbiont of Gigantopelta aegis TaxID=2794934 RepID=UPI0018DE301C|nr:flagellar basal body L-ring protein FlgH [sulfur-oxidizing endosymbiont of Gigantopelta aegis]
MTLLTGCAAQRLEHDPKYAPTRPKAVITQPQNTGSIYLTSDNLNLFETVKAHRVGDILTVVFDEKTTGKKETKTEDKKGTTVGLSNPTVFGKAVTTDATTGNATSDAGFGLANELLRALNTSISSTNDFKSKGKSEQKNSLTGNIGVTVVEVLSNGNLRVQGEKLVTINQGDEYIQLAGVIRSRDVGLDNKISSSKVANAQIIYSGVGLTHDSNSAGWGSRFFLSDVWPF